MPTETLNVGQPTPKVIERLNLPPKRPPVDSRLVTIQWFGDDGSGPHEAEVEVYRVPVESDPFELLRIYRYVVDGEDLVPIEHALNEIDWYFVRMLINEQSRRDAIEEAFR